MTFQSTIDLRPFSLDRGSRRRLMWAGVIWVCAWIGVTLGTPMVTPVHADESFLSAETLTKSLIPLTGNDSRSVDLRIHFKLGSKQLTRSAENQLAELFSALQSEDLNALKVRIVGHTDALGAADLNRQLSLDRATAVRDYLLKRGMEQSRLTTDGQGENSLLPDRAPTDPAHRRVEIITKRGQEDTDPMNSDGTDGYQTLN